jgi:hypothetical protein
MPRPFSPATAEQVIAAVEAVVVNGSSATLDFVAEFIDLPHDKAEAALKLAADLQFLSPSGTGGYTAASPLCRFTVTPDLMDKAAVLRIVLEAYEPFVVFRARLSATNQVAASAQQTKAALGLDAHREAVKDTLISLGTYSHALVTEGGGHYRSDNNAANHPLQRLSNTCSTQAAAEGRVREQLGSDTVAGVSHTEVVAPLADALVRAQSGDPRGAVVLGGNSVESFLDEVAQKISVSLTGANGINAKLDKLTQAGKLPKKLGHVGKYLGHVRNAADHGIDAEVGASWAIRGATGLEYVFVACSFMAATWAHAEGRSPEI